MQKFFEGYLMNFSKSSRNLSLYEKMSLDKEGKNTQAAKFFSHHAKIFVWEKIFCSLSIFALFV